MKGKKKGIDENFKTSRVGVGISGMRGQPAFSKHLQGTMIHDTYAYTLKKHN
jgi:hypothetical protein